MRTFNPLIKPFASYMDSLPVRVDKKQLSKGILLSMQTMDQMNQAFETRKDRLNNDLQEQYFNHYLLKILSGYNSLKQVRKIIKQPAYYNYSSQYIEQTLKKKNKEYLNIQANIPKLKRAQWNRNKLQIKSHLIHFKTNSLIIEAPKSIIKLAKIKSLLYTIKYLERLQHKQNTPTRIVQEKSPLYWNANKTDLVELLYALHHHKAIKGYKSLSRLVKHAEVFLNINLGQYHKTHSEICMRSKGIDYFLKTLCKELIESCETEHSDDID